MSNFAKDGFVGDRVILGPEHVNGTGQVYLDVQGPIHLSNAEAREIAAALVEAADYASERQAEENA
ncbi:hypothetical protein [Streptomyces sp. CBMA152]|uniref:hypothetical protein n=1 Tax=Streptomyces sp. CBMA152 TaxID=1896312 RepID=UPI00166119D1|nr:hypothetical protein [Streptomyces sp. CBMA152]MBD0743577.1 hypothetical protein [Streptomyces sp. CBMA152]